MLKILNRGIRVFPSLPVPRAGGVPPRHACEHIRFPSSDTAVPVLTPFLPPLPRRRRRARKRTSHFFKKVLINACIFSRNLVNYQYTPKHACTSLNEKNPENRRCTNEMTIEKRPNFYFYDIESLDNVFTLANFRVRENILDLFYVCDDPPFLDYLRTPEGGREAASRIRAKNRNFTGGIVLHDLSYIEQNELLAKMFGLSTARSVNDPASCEKDLPYGTDYRLVCDTDPEYDPEKHPFLVGYNSFNYDTTMLALYLTAALSSVSDRAPDGSMLPPRLCRYLVGASVMRGHNNVLFSPAYKSSMPNYLKDSGKSAAKQVRKNMLASGRHLDIARLNEKQQHVGLKRLLGMKGFQILESSKLRPDQSKIENLDQLFDLFAYNCSDVINLLGLYQDKLYEAQYLLKSGLLKQYPELRYEQKGPNIYAPDVSPARIRYDRLAIDSSSSQFAQKSLCPYDHLNDQPVVSYMYPSKKQAAELGIEPFNVLERTKALFYDIFPQPELRSHMDRIYEYYKAIEGKNFNESDAYAETYLSPSRTEPLQSALREARETLGLVADEREIDLTPRSMSALPPADTTMIYYDKNGDPTSCFVIFSTGGIHGAEYNKRLYDADVAVYNEAAAIMAKVQAQYPVADDLKKAKQIVIDGKTYGAAQFLQTKKKDQPNRYKILSAPQLFIMDKKGMKLNPRYNYTSAELSNHEDFTSYYPIMLVRLSAFENPGLGYDRYSEIFDNKSKYGKLMKDKSLPEADRGRYSVMREGTKLVLNSASGAGDAKFDSNIRMNNRVISMRIIGQLFSFTIGMAQAYEGARVISTNTDGLFTVMEENRNNQILEEQSKDIHVDIEPELTFLISKDSNNRIEMDHEHSRGGELQRASGGSLACCDGPSVTKSLSHPAVIDYALCEYLIMSSWTHVEQDSDRYPSLEDPFDDEKGMRILRSLGADPGPAMSPQRQLLFFQNIVASSPSSNRYVFSTDVGGANPEPLQHYNRVFLVKDGTPGAVNIKVAAMYKLTPVIIAKRKRENCLINQHDPVARRILEVNGVDVDTFPSTHEASVVSVTGIEADWPVIIENGNINDMSDSEANAILDKLDFDKYLTLLRNTFEKNWRNKTPDPDAAIFKPEPPKAPKPPKTPKTRKKTKKTTDPDTVPGAPDAGLSEDAAGVAGMADESVEQIAGVAGTSDLSAEASCAYPDAVSNGNISGMPLREETSDLNAPLEMEYIPLPEPDGADSIGNELDEPRPDSGPVSAGKPVTVEKPKDAVKAIARLLSTSSELALNISDEDVRASTGFDSAQALRRAIAALSAALSAGTAKSPERDPVPDEN